MLKAYKYRIYPNNEQKIQIAKTFGCCRLRHTVLQEVCTMYSFIRRIRATVTRQQAAVTGHPEHKEKQKKRGTGDAHHVMPWRRENLSGL